MTDTIGALLLDSYSQGRRRGAHAYRYAGASSADNPYDPELQPHAHRGWRDAWQCARERHEGKPPA